MTSQECDLLPYKGMKLFPIAGTKLIIPYKGIKSGVNLKDLCCLFFFYILINFKELELVSFYYFNLLLPIME